MHIDHIAIWSRDIERLRLFYETYFHAESGSRYENPRKQFSSYFLTFSNGARLELMQTTGIGERNAPQLYPVAGWAHLAFSLGSKQAVDELTRRLEADGYRIAGAPRTTGDGYYESVALDPDGNRIELIG